MGWVCLLVFAGFSGRPLQAVEYEAIKDPFWQRLAIHINGLSLHFGGSTNEINELNWGGGFTYDLGRLSSGSRILNGAVFSANADIYSDSFSQLGYAFGVALQNKVVGPIDFGLQVGLIHEENIERKGGYYLTPYLLPYLETTFDFPINLRLTLIPPLGSLTEGVLTLQAMIRF